MQAIITTGDYLTDLPQQETNEKSEEFELEHSLESRRSLPDISDTSCFSVDFWAGMESTPS